MVGTTTGLYGVMSAVAEMPGHLEVILALCRSVQANVWTVTYLKTNSEQLQRSPFRSAYRIVTCSGRLTRRWKGCKEINRAGSFRPEFVFLSWYEAKLAEPERSWYTLRNISCHLNGHGVLLLSASVALCQATYFQSSSGLSSAHRNVGTIVFWQLGLERSLALSEAQVVGRPLTEDAWVRSQASLCEICSGRSGTGTSFAPSNSLFHRQNHSTLLHTYSFTHHRRCTTLPIDSVSKYRIYSRNSRTFF